MKKLFSITFAALLCTVVMFSTIMTASAKFDQTAGPKKGDTVAVMHTNYGDIAISFFEKYAPKGVENFVTLAKDGKYDNTIFHRVIKGFMIQGGDYTNFNGTGGVSCWGKEFENECVDNLKNIRGSISYANRGADTNGSQFFINSVDNNNLDGSYTVFGQVFAGMDVVDLISDCEVTNSSDNQSSELSEPVNKVEVKSVEVTKYKKGIEKKLAAPVDPYEGQTSQEATEITTANNNENSEASANTSYTPIIVIGIAVLVIAIIVVIYVIYDRLQTKKKAEIKAKKYPNKKKRK